MPPEGPDPGRRGTAALGEAQGIEAEIPRDAELERIARFFAAPCAAKNAPK
jgi:hypothetical protein